MKEVLKDYPDLVEDFIAFLEPEEAVELGVVSNSSWIIIRGYH